MDAVKREVLRGDVSSVLPLIAEKARSTWNKLPQHAQSFQGLDDLIQEGVNHTVSVVKTHKDKRVNSKVVRAKFSTYLYTTLDNYYTDKLREVYADKRHTTSVVYSLESNSTIKTTSGKEMSIERYLRSRKDFRYTIEDEILESLDAERIFLKVYSHSSASLRRYLLRWFCFNTETKMKMYGARFLEARKELRSLSKTYGLSPDHIRRLIVDEKCNQKVITMILHNYRTPKNHSLKTAPLAACLEADLVKCLV
jgi:hypothetical protein